MMSRSRHDRTPGKTISDRRCGENYCGVLWKVMSSAKYVAISKLSESEFKVWMTKI